MSSLTKTQFRDECKTRSSAISLESDSVIETFIDLALRAYSRRRPEVRVSADNSVVDGQELYDFPASAMSIIKILDSDGLEEILFAVTDEGAGNQFRLGNIKQHSFADLLEENYYVSPDSQSSSLSVATGYETFDIEYTLLHDMASISDEELELLYYHVLYSTYNKKAETALATSATEVTTTPTSLMDRDARGETTQVTYTSRTSIAKQYSDLAKEALDNFNTALKNFSYGTRG